jgi:7,8-dihydro-6-hydroxymethylpterin-pyrophosphokinase
VEGSGHLRIPRPELREAFVLVPLFDIAPDARVPPEGRTVAELRHELGPLPELERVSIELSGQADSAAS